MATLVFLDYKTFCVINKIIIEFAFRGISRIIEASVSIICDNANLNNSRYSAQAHPKIIKLLNVMLTTTTYIHPG